MILWQFKWNLYPRATWIKGSKYSTLVILINLRDNKAYSFIPISLLDSSLYMDFER